MRDGFVGKREEAGMKIYKLAYDADLFDQAEIKSRDIADAYDSNLKEIS